MKAVLDPNVIISGLLSPRGAPGTILKMWASGALEVVISDMLMDELARVLKYPKIASRIDTDRSKRFLRAIGKECETVPDIGGPLRVESRDPDDNYLIGLAEHSRSVLISGDSDLLDLADRIPVFSPAEFLRFLDPDG